MRRLALIFLDFDGVILESNQPKEQAFREAFQSLGPQAMEAIAFSETNSAMTRYQKIDYIFREIVKVEPTKERTGALISLINRLSYEKVVAAEEVPGAIKFLQQYHTLVPLHVVSATPIDQLTPVLKARSLDKYFAGVYGVPPVKDVTFREVLAQAGVSPAEALFVGDSASDYDASRKAGVPFLGRYAGKSFGGTPDALMDDFQGIEKILPVDAAQRTVFASFLNAE